MVRGGSADRSRLTLLRRDRELSPERSLPGDAGGSGLTRVGEAAWRIALPSSEQVARACDRLRGEGADRVLDAVPGARSVLVLFRDLPDERDRSWLEGIAAEGEQAASVPEASARRCHEIPVRYDGADLQEVARQARLSVADAIALHASATYCVAFVGFQPGFAYLDGLPERLWTPRRSTPRPAVPSGAVGIGGEWTGIYPAATPGGWNLIGRTEVRLFDPHAATPALLAPGDLVRLVPT